MKKMEAKSGGKRLNIFRRLIYALYYRIILVYSWFSYKFIHSRLIPCPFGNGDVIVLKRHWPSDKVYEDFANSYKEKGETPPDKDETWTHIIKRCWVSLDNYSYKPTVMVSYGHPNCKGCTISSLYTMLEHMDIVTINGKKPKLYNWSYV